MCKASVFRVFPLAFSFFIGAMALNVSGDPRGRKGQRACPGPSCKKWSWESSPDFPVLALCFIDQNPLLPLLCQSHQSSLEKVFVGSVLLVAAGLTRRLQPPYGNEKVTPEPFHNWKSTDGHGQTPGSSSGSSPRLLKEVGRRPSSQKSNEDLLASQQWEDSPRIQNYLIPYSRKKLRGISIPALSFFRSKIQGCRRKEDCSWLETRFQVIVDLRVRS